VRLPPRLPRATSYPPHPRGASRDPVAWHLSVARTTYSGSVLGAVVASECLFYPAGQCSERRGNPELRVLIHHSLVPLCPLLESISASFPRDLGALSPSLA